MTNCQRSSKDFVHGRSLGVDLIVANEGGLLRHCVNPGCDDPYFIAAHPKAAILHGEMRGMAQAQAKRAWRKEKGKKWLKHNAIKTAPTARTR
jgi:hypothetical protein